MLKLSELADLTQIIGVPIIIAQLFYAIKSYVEEHERARRENAVGYLSAFAQSLDQKSSIARKLMERFDKEQCLSLAKQESFVIDLKYLEELKAIFSLKSAVGSVPKELLSVGNQIQVTEEQSAYLRWIAMVYLNSIESLLLSWRHNVADRKMIEEECENLVDDKEGNTILENLREVFGKESCPAIDEFVAKTRSKRKSIPGEPKLGKLFFPSKK